MALLNRGRLFGSDPLRHTAAAVPAAADAVGHDYVDAADDEHEADAILRGAAAAAAPAGPREDPPAAAAGSAARAGNSPPGSAKQGKARTRVLEELLSREEDARRQLVQELQRMRAFVWRWTALCAVLTVGGALMALVGWLAATVVQLNAQMQVLQQGLQSVSDSQAQTAARLASTSQQLMAYQYEEYDRRGARHHDGCIIC